MAEITRLESVIKGRETEITQWEKEARELVEIITKYDLAKGAYEDIVKSGKFTADELDAPARLTAKVTQELREVDSAMETHNKRGGNMTLKQSSASGEDALR